MFEVLFIIKINNDLYVMIILESSRANRRDKFHISDHHSNIQRSQKCFGKVGACHSGQALVTVLPYVEEMGLVELGMTSVGRVKFFMAETRKYFVISSSDPEP
jgi:hypothetical protein